MLTVMVLPDNTFAGLSRINEFYLVENRPDNDPDLDKLEVKLAEQKASPFFAERTDVEISGDPVLPYARLVMAGEVAYKVGFHAIRFVSVNHASAVPRL